MNYNDLLGSIKALESRLAELKKLKGVVSGNTQINFTLTATSTWEGNGSFTLNIGEIDKNYRSCIKEAYTMVKLGLIKGLDKEADVVKDQLTELYVQQADFLETQAKSIRIKAVEVTNNV